MKKLSNKSYQAIRLTIEKYARPLEQSLFRYYFEQGSASDVIKELALFQNEDGGFGHGIEPDYVLEASSA